MSDADGLKVPMCVLRYFPIKHEPTVSEITPEERKAWRFAWDTAPDESDRFF